MNLLVDAGLLRVVRTRRVRVAQIPQSGDQVYGFVAGLYPPTRPRSRTPRLTQPTYGYGCRDRLLKTLSMAFLGP